MKKSSDSNKFHSLLPYFLLAVAVIVAYKAINELPFFLGLIKQIWGIITPFFYGFMLAYIINIPCNGIQKLLAKTKIKFIVKRKKNLSIVLVYIIAAILIFLVLNWIIPIVLSSISLFISNFSSYYERTLLIIDYVNNFEIFGRSVNLETVFDQIGSMFRNFSPERLLMPINALFGVSSAIFTGFLTIISSVYILAEKDNFKGFLHRVMKAFISIGTCKIILHYADRINKNFKQYISTQTIDGLIIGTIVSIELYLLGSPFFLVLGIMLAILNYIPYFGSIFGSVLAVLVISFTQGIARGAITAVVIIITQQIDSNIIQPKLMSGSFSLSAFLVIVSVTVGGAVAGVLGMIAAIPIVAVLKDILESVLTYYEDKKRMVADEKDKTNGT